MAVTDRTHRLLAINLESAALHLGQLLDALEMEKTAISNGVDAQMLSEAAGAKTQSLAEIERNLQYREHTLQSLGYRDFEELVQAEPDLAPMWAAFCEQVQLAATLSRANAARIQVLASQTDEALEFLHQMAHPKEDAMYTSRGHKKVAAKTVVAGHA